MPPIASNSKAKAICASASTALAIATAGVAERQLGLGALLVGDHLVDQLRRCADDGKLSLSSSEVFKRRRMTPQALRPLIISTTGVASFQVVVHLVRLDVILAEDLAQRALDQASVFAATHGGPATLHPAPDVFKPARRERGKRVVELMERWPR